MFFCGMNTNKRLQLGLRYGLLFGVLIFLVEIALWYSGLSTLTNSNGWTTWVLAGLGIYLATDQFKKASDGYATFGDIVATGSWAGVFGGIIYALAALIRMLADPSFCKALRSFAENQMEDQNIPEETVETISGIYQVLFSPVPMALMGLVGVFFVFLLTSLVVGVFGKKEPGAFDNAKT